MKVYFSLPNFLIFILFPLTGAGLIPFFKYEMNPDALSYYSIALKYLNGQFAEAINGYWSPLLSWTLIPLLLLKIPPIIAFKIHTIIVIVFIGLVLKKLAPTYSLSPLTTVFLIVCVFALLLPFGFIISTPDILLLLILLIYIALLFSGEYLNDLKYGALCGLAGALAYLCKAYAFYFFLLHFTLFHILFALKHRTALSGIVRSYFTGMAIFILISGIWITAISRKYDKLTISTAGAYNLAIMADGKGDQYMEYAGFIPPPNPTAIVGWEDPGLFQIRKWNPLASGKDMLRLAKNTYDNLRRAHWYFLEISFLTLGLLFYLLFGMLRKPSFTEGLLNHYSYLLLTIVLYSGGYMFLILERRYFLLPLSLIILSGALLLNQASRFLNHRWKRLSLTIAVSLTFVIPAIDYIRWNLYPGKEEFVYAERLKNKYNIHGNMASDSKWYKTLLITYNLHSRYFGIPEPGISKEKLLEELKKYPIDYYFDWTHSEVGHNFPLDEFEEVTGGQEPEVRIYKIR